MTNYKEEQELELEALTSIFTEGAEFERISDTEFLLKLKPDPTGEEENHVGVTLRIAYTDEYPDTAPDWELKDEWGLSDEKLKELKAKVEETIDGSIGMAMVYTVAEACQDYLKENNVKSLSMHEEMMLRQGGGDGAAEEEEDEEEEDDEDEEEEIWKGLADKALCDASDRITVESFMAWKEKFDAEMIEKGVLKREENRAKSGKQFFLEAQAAEKAPSAAAEGAAAKGAAEGGALVYNAALFGEEEDDDLDDLED
mmetsp:Transcript_29715/g.52222  ORF Transcript_29715/g.52222 Transcript_29715/m.52222 type:complete len:256 (-) Transcript_29715:101-868(-)